MTVPTAQPSADAAATKGAAPYRRVLLKVSGEALMGEGSFGLDPETVNRIAADVGLLDWTEAGAVPTQLGRDFVAEA